ncbi:N-acetyltransferase [Polaromonas sp.]|uniref:N-acetyltransferase n=1 Tax=Polaromonas sp. TaxID=1869339 RepID=UPI003565E8DE
MPLTWTHQLTDIDWSELSALYLAAPLGNKSPTSLQTVFTNSMFRCFVHADGKFVGLGKEIVGKLMDLSRGHRKTILYAVPGKEDFYRKLGFKRMTTAMTIFDDQARAMENGYINET